MIHIAPAAALTAIRRIIAKHPLRKRSSSGLRLPDTPLPQPTRQGLAGALGATICVYMATDPGIVSAPTLAMGGVAGLGLGLFSLRARNLSASIAGLVTGAVCGLVHAMAARWLPGTMEDSVLMELFAGILYGTMAESTLRECAQWPLRIVTRSRKVVRYGAGAITLALIVLVGSGQDLPPLMDLIEKASSQLLIAIAASGFAALVAVCCGWGIGWVLKRLLSPSSNDDERETVARWNVLYGG